LICHTNVKAIYFDLFGCDLKLFPNELCLTLDSHTSSGSLSTRAPLTKRTQSICRNLSSPFFALHLHLPMPVHNLLDTFDYHFSSFFVELTRLHVVFMFADSFGGLNLSAEDDLNHRKPTTSVLFSFSQFALMSAL
jgi:hypothetical protein